MPTTASPRYSSIDFLRGLVMVIMALDHTRDFFHINAMTGDPLDAATTNAPLYFTRWITHFCAPIFVFLSGLSAHIAARKKTPPEARSFLVKRGLWLVLVEIVVVTFLLTFNPFYNFIVLQVIWAIGISMVLLGLLSFLSPKTFLFLGLLLVVGHNVFDYITKPEPGVARVLLDMFFTASPSIVPLSPSRMLGLFYAVLPWTGLMFVGYGLGPVFSAAYEPARRRKLLLQAGAFSLLLFVLLRWVNGYGDSLHWKSFGSFPQTLFSFLNVSKYPPSLLYSLVTVGTGLLVLALVEPVSNGLTAFFGVYGRVPFFYYILHFFLIHFTEAIAFFASGHTATQIADPGSIFLFRPVNFGYPLPVVYMIWIAIVLSLYYPCRRFGRYKAAHPEKKWLSYL